MKTYEIVLIIVLYIIPTILWIMYGVYCGVRNTKMFNKVIMPMGRKYRKVTFDIFINAITDEFKTYAEPIEPNDTSSDEIKDFLRSMESDFWIRYGEYESECYLNRLHEFYIGDDYYQIETNGKVDNVEPFCTNKLSFTEVVMNYYNARNKDYILSRSIIVEYLECYIFIFLQKASFLDRIKATKILIEDIGYQPPETGAVKVRFNNAENLKKFYSL